MDGKIQLPHRVRRGKGGLMENELMSFLASLVMDFASESEARP